MNQKTKIHIALNASRETLIILKYSLEQQLEKTSENLPEQIRIIKNQIKLCKIALRKIDDV